MKKVPVAEVRDHLPDDTPVVTPNSAASICGRAVKALSFGGIW